jgi:hypothetical protein
MKFSKNDIINATHRIEIDLVEFCDLKCYQCIRVVNDAKSNRMMKLNQITEFVDDSIKLGYKWDVIHIIGGEPTLHPQIIEICNELSRYKKYNINCKIELCTNGRGKLKEITHLIPKEIYVSNCFNNKTNDGDDLRHFDFYNAPWDHKIDVKNETCAIWSCCGIGLGPYGYLPCHVCAGLVRVFNIACSVKKLSDITENWLINSLNQYCSKCGAFFWYIGIPKEQMFKELSNKKQNRRSKMSDSWEKALNEYNIHKTDRLVL